LPFIPTGKESGFAAAEGNDHEHIPSIQPAPQAIAIHVLPDPGMGAEAMKKHDDPGSTRPDTGKIQMADSDQDLKDWTVDGLRAFAGIVRKASDNLAGARPATVASLLDRAAGNLESLSAHGRMPAALPNDVRRLTEENPAAVIAWSILASFALGDEADTFSPVPANEQAEETGIAEAPIQTAQTGAGGPGYLESPPGTGTT